jgi:branched-chain amino acid transport system permease protein
MSRRTRKKVVWIAIIITMIILPILVTDPYYVDIMIMVAFNSILALTWRTIMRIGQLSFGHAAFIGIGAYASALIVMKLGVSFWLALPLSGVASAAISIPIGFTTLRLRGMFFAITTWAFNEIMRSAYLIFRNPFGGATGLYGIPPPNHIHLPGLPLLSFGDKGAYCYLSFFLVFVTVLALVRIEKSRIGMIFDAIRVDDNLAESVGINLMRYKCLAFAIACFFAGVAGSFYAHYLSFISPYSFELTLSVDAIVFAMVGGLTSITGSLIGAGVLTILSNLLHAAGFFKMIIFSIFLVSFVLFLPDGMISLPQRIRILMARISGKPVN